MPSKRKRIGFLPRSEVQYIIEKICKQNKLSQSKVTGILVEEALNYRGVLKCTIDKLSSEFKDKDSDCNQDTKVYSNSKTTIDDNYTSLDEIVIKDEIKMINDFIEFKFFKKIMNKNKNNI